MATVPTVIRSGDHPFHFGLSDLWSYRELLYFLVWRDVRVRYKQTLLGVAWAVLQPLLTMVLFAVVFGRLAGMPSDGRPYPLFSLAALVPWTYFATALAGGANSLVGSQNLISKVYFPRLLIPAASVVTPLVDCVIAFGLLAVGLLWYGVVPTAAAVLIPVFMLLATGTALGATLWLSALNVEYRDVRYVVPFLIQFWMFATPVVYPVSLAPERWRPLFGINPMATVIEGFRWTLLGTTPPPLAMVLVSSIVLTAAFLSGLAYFRRMEDTFADVI